MSGKVEVELLTSFGGEFAGMDSPSIGTRVKVDPELAAALEEDGRGRIVEPPAKKEKPPKKERASPTAGPRGPVVERAVAGPPPETATQT